MSENELVAESNVVSADDLRKALLTRPVKVPTEDVKVMRNGEPIGVVTVRGLSRKEALKISDKENLSALSAEQALLSIALVNPKMSEKDIAEWQAVAQAGELNDIVTQVRELSGTNMEATKEAMKQFRE